MKILFFSPAPVMMCLNIAYRLSCCKDDTVTLMVDEREYARRDYNNYLESLKQKQIFDEVIYGNLFINRVHLPTKSDEVKKYVTECYDKSFADIGCDLSYYDEIAVFNDGWCSDINLYLNYIEREYRWIEVGPNTLMRGAACNYPKSLKDEFNRLNAESALAKYAYPVLHKTSGSSISVMKEQEKKYELWSLDEIIRTVPNDILDDIMGCYRVGDDFEENVFLFIANSYGASIYFSEVSFTNHYVQRIIGYNEYELDELFAVVYLFLLDIFMPRGTVYIKFHPNDPMLEGRKSELYPSSVKVFPDAPFEFVREYFFRKKIKIKHLLGMQSDSFININDELYDYKTLLGLSFFKTMHCYASLYIISLLLDFLSIEKIAASKEIAEQLHILSKGKLECIHIKGYEDIRKVAENRGVFIILDAIHHDFREAEIRAVNDDKFLCFLNVGFSECFIPSELFLEFVPIEIEKNSKGFSSPLLYSEFLWIYTKSAYNRRKLRKFYLNQEMSFSNINLCTRTHTIREEIEMAKRIVGKKVLERMNEKIRHFSDMEKVLWEVALEGTSAMSMSAIMRQYNDISEYLSILSVVKRKYMVICAVRDTPGSSIKLELLNKIRSIGFKNFSTELWRMYVGILWEDKTLFDMGGAKREEPIDIYCSNSFYTTDIHVISKAWRNGNVANVYINGKDYSANIRGINIVVYDPKEKVVLDSIGFDGHYNEYRFVRCQI